MKNHENDNTGEFSDFNEFNLYMNFAICLKMAIPELILDIILVFFPQKWQFRHEIENFEIPQNSA